MFSELVLEFGNLETLHVHSRTPSASRSTDKCSCLIVLAYYILIVTHDCILNSVLFCLSLLYIKVWAQLLPTPTTPGTLVLNLLQVLLLFPDICTYSLSIFPSLPNPYPVKQPPPLSRGGVIKIAQRKSPS